MKVFIFLMTALFAFQLNAQTCLSSGIKFETQLEIDNFATNYPSCTTVLGSVTIKESAPGAIINLNGLSQIKYINDYFWIIQNSNLQDLTGLSGLITLRGGSVMISNNSGLKSLSGLTNLRSIYGELHVKLNNLTDLTGLNKIDTMLLGFSVNNSNIKSLNGLDRLSQCGYFQVQKCPKVTDLKGVPMLTALTQGLHIGSNAGLTSLDGLEQLTSIGDLIRINNNNHLQSIQGIANIDPTTIKANWSGDKDLNIYGNPFLSDCEIESVCGAIHIANATTNIQNNAPGCNSTTEIQCNFLSGIIFYDANQNQIKDPTEVGLSDVNILFSPSGDLVTPLYDGTYSKLCTAGNAVSITPAIGANWSITTTPTTYNVTCNPGSPTNLNNNFGVFPNFVGHYGDVDLSSFNTRCNTDVDFKLQYKNTGTFTDNGKVTLTYDPTTTFVSATPPPSFIDVAAHLLEWNYTSLAPFNQNDIDLTFTMPNQNSAGSPLLFQAEMLWDNAGTFPTLDNYNYTPIVLCSYDPNDKQVIPAGVRDEHYTLHNTKLTYTVRCQNTGNAAAIDIRIHDTLSSSLDMSTFRVLSSSFPVLTSISGNSVEFYFKNIWLADSTSNEPESHGYVTFEISPIAGLTDFTKIENTAFIYFDFNTPVVTNTTWNTMVTMIPVGIHSVNSADVYIHPNPASSNIQITSSAAINEIFIYNQLGQLMAKYDTSIINTSLYPSGVYYVKIKGNNQVGVGKLVIE